MLKGELSIIQKDNNMITIKQKGDFRNTERFFDNSKKFDISTILNKFGEAGVNALASATPRETGLTAASWSYEIETGSDHASIFWTNSNTNANVNIAVILQYGHGTGTGGYVQGIDYINPSIRPVFDDIADQAWKEVTK